MACPIHPLGVRFQPVAPANADFDAQYQILNDPNSTADQKNGAKTALKGLGLDIEKMTITKGNDLKTTHRVSLFTTRFGKEEAIKVEVLLPTDGAKAAFLYAQHKLFFPVLAQQKSTFIDGAVAQYKVSEDNAGAKLELKKMQISKFKAHEGFFGCFRNWGREETWTAAQIATLGPNRQPGDEGVPYTQHTAHLAVASQNLGIMKKTDAYREVYRPAIRKVFHDRDGASSHENQVPALIDIKTAIDANPNVSKESKKLLDLLIQAQATQNAMTDSLLDELIEAIHLAEIQDLENWSSLALSDYNPEKVANLAAHLKEFVDRLHASAQQSAAIRPLKTQLALAKSTHAEFTQKMASWTQSSQQANEIQGHVVEIEQEETQNALEALLIEQTELKKQAAALKTNLTKGHAELLTMSQTYTSAKNSFKQHLQAISADEQDYHGLVLPKELNTEIEGLNPLPDVTPDMLAQLINLLEPKLEQLTQNIEYIQEAIEAADDEGIEEID